MNIIHTKGLRKIIHPVCKNTPGPVGTPLQTPESLGQVFVGAMTMSLQLWCGHLHEVSPIPQWNWAQPRRGRTQSCDSNISWSISIDTSNKNGSMDKVIMDAIGTQGFLQS